MIRKILIILAASALAAGLFGCGGGNSTSDTPTGVNPGVVSRVELMATSYVNQSNGYCYLKTKVLDGNGTPVQNRQVVWTNLSTTGILDTTTSTTNESGIATATLYSTTWGFATVQSEVNADNTGTEKIRDRKTVYFTPFDMAWPSTGGGGTTIDLAALILDVDSNDNGVYNEPSDFILFDPPGKTDALIRATVTDTLGAPLLNSAVTFGADSPEVTFPLGSDPNAPIVHTNAAGQASVLARVSPSILRNTESTVNITAAADNNTFNVLTLFLKPVTVDTVTVAANPSTVASAGTSAISATVKTTAGNPVPANTIVNFTTSAGSIVPFAATDVSGVATAQLTAPTVTTSKNVTVTASVGGKSGSTTVTVTAASVALNVIPDTQTMPLPILVGQTARYTIIGGTPPYSVFSDNAAVAKGSITGSTMTAMIASVPTGATIVNFSIFDSVGAKKDVKLNLNIVGGGGTGSMLVQPSSATVAGIQNPDTSAADNLTFAITGGATPFNCISNNTAIIASPGAVNNTTSSFTVDPTSVAVSTVVTITCTDTNNLVASTVITVTPQPFSITTDVTNVIGISNPDAQPSDNVTVTVAGGSGPYIVQSSNPALTPPGIWSSTTPPVIPLPGSFTFDANSVGQNTVVTLTAFDNTGATATKNITIFPQFNSANPVISLNKSQVVGLTNPDASTADDITFTVTGGTPPYAISLGLTCPTAFDSALMARQWTLAVSGATQLVDPTSPTAIENCTLTVTDSNSNISSITFTVNP